MRNLLARVSAEPVRLGLHNVSYLKVENPHKSSDGLIRDYCDGEQFRNHPLFSVDSKALQIMVYYDDLETCNPLGSRATKHKLGNLRMHS